jgi:hypothetical protein
LALAEEAANRDDDTMAKNMEKRRQSMVRAVLTDVQFWVPALVLAGGVVLLVLLH